MQTNLTGEVAFLAGSTAGVGKAIAIKLAQNGADIVLNGRNPAASTALIKQIGELGRRAIFEKADVTDYQEIKQAVNNALEKLGKIDIMVASGGGTGISMSFFQETDPAAYLNHAKNLWWSRLYCIRAVLDHMIERRRGKIILIVADSGRWPTPSECLSGGASAALVLNTKVLAMELGRWQIRVNAISLPPLENTPSYDYAIQLSSSMAHIFKKALAKQSFPTTVEDIAETALFFSSDDSNAITGQTLSVNGGLCFPG